MLGQIIEWASGKKTTIATIIAAIVMFAVGRNWIAQDVAELISIVMVALGLTANIATAKYFQKLDNEFIAQVMAENAKAAKKVKKTK